MAETMISFASIGMVRTGSRVFSESFFQGLHQSVRYRLIKNQLFNRGRTEM